MSRQRSNHSKHSNVWFSPAAEVPAVIFVSALSFFSKNPERLWHAYVRNPGHLYLLILHRSDQAISAIVVKSWQDAQMDWNWLADISRNCNTFFSYQIQLHIPEQSEKHNYRIHVYNCVSTQVIFHKILIHLRQVTTKHITLSCHLVWCYFTCISMVIELVFT